MGELLMQGAHLTGITQIYASRDRDSEKRVFVGTNTATEDRMRSRAF